MAQSITRTARIGRIAATLIFVAVWLSVILAVLKSQRGLKENPQVRRETPQQKTAPKVGVRGTEDVSRGPLPPRNPQEEREELKNLFCFGRNRRGKILTSERERLFRQQQNIPYEERDAASDRDGAERIVELWEEKRRSLIRSRERSAKDPTWSRGVLQYFEREMRQATKCRELLDEAVFDRIMALPPEHRKAAAVEPEILAFIENALKEKRLDAPILRSSKKR